MNSENKGPLAGVRVLEFTHAVMGPTAGLVLADMGADVIRVERTPDGDPTRRLKGFGSGYATFFNRNKRSIVLDIKQADGRAAVHRLLQTTDILIENFAPGTMDRIGLGYETLKTTYPRLIYCSLKGFLPGPYDHRTALDEVVQMMAGLAYMTGPRGRPLRAGASIIDIMGGTFGALASLVALRERETTGRGQLVQNGLFETAAFIMGQHMAYGAVEQIEVPPMPERIAAWAIYRIFDTADDHQVFIGVTSDKHWRRFCETFERPDLFAREDLRSNNQRIDARDELLPELERFFKTMALADIMQKAEAAGIPFAPIAQPEDLYTDPHLSGGGYLRDITLPDGRTAPLPQLPLRMERTDFPVQRQAPRIGEHTRAILAEIGYETDTIEALLAQGVAVEREDYA